MRLSSFSFVARRSFLGSLGWLQSLLEKPERYREMQKLEHTFLVQDHLVYSFKGRAPRGV